MFDYFFVIEDREPRVLAFDLSQIDCEIEKFRRFLFVFDRLLNLLQCESVQPVLFDQLTIRMIF